MPKAKSDGLNHFLCTEYRAKKKIHWMVDDGGLGMELAWMCVLKPKRGPWCRRVWACMWHSNLETRTRTLTCKCGCQVGEEEAPTSHSNFDFGLGRQELTYIHACRPGAFASELSTPLLRIVVRSPHSLVRCPYYVRINSSMYNYWPLGSII